MGPALPPGAPGGPGSKVKPRDRVLMEVVLHKEAGVGLGIGLCCVPSGDSSPGIYIHTLSPGSVAHMDSRLRCGDEIMEINDTVVSGMALNDVYSVLSQCPPGPVHIIISRHPDPKVSELQLNNAIAQAVENTKLRRDRSLWSVDGTPSRPYDTHCTHGVASPSPSTPTALQVPASTVNRILPNPLRPTQKAYAVALLDPRTHHWNIRIMANFSNSLQNKENCI